MEKAQLLYVFCAFLLAVITADGATESLSAGDYIVDCSGCQYAPITDVKAYSCNVRCKSNGEVDFNLEGVYEMLEARMAKLERKIETLNKAVSFSVRLSVQTSFAADTVIKYDRVITNIGDAYSTADGKFTAPYNGTYQFTIVVMNRGGTYGAYGHVQLDGESKCSAYAVGNNIHNTGTCTVILPLVVGDKVYVVNPDFAVTTVYHGGFTSFTGNALNIEE